MTKAEIKAKLEELASKQATAIYRAKQHVDYLKTNVVSAIDLDAQLMELDDVAQEIQDMANGIEGEHKPADEAKVEEVTPEAKAEPEVEVAPEAQEMPTIEAVPADDGDVATKKKGK